MTKKEKRRLAKAYVLRVAAESLELDLDSGAEYLDSEDEVMYRLRLDEQTLLARTLRRRAAKLDGKDFFHNVTKPTQE